MSWCPNQLAKSESSAPMLLVGGGPGRRTCRQNCWVNIERISPEGRNLRQALETCLARSEQLRRKSEELNGYQDYLQFLSHELKTPLTAAQTALQLLLGEADDVSDARRREFLDIALRNLRRLGNTITWSEDYLNDRMAPAAPNWSRQGAGSLIVELVRSGDDDELAVECDAAVGKVELVTDVRLLRSLLRQVNRALRYHAPGARLGLGVTLAGGGADGSRLVLAYRIEAGGGAVGGVARTALVARAEEPGRELLRLVEFTVPEEVRQTLGAELIVPSSPPDRHTVLELALPLSPADRPATRRHPALV
jgi:hypothetical protein